MYYIASIYGEYLNNEINLDKEFNNKKLFNTIQEAQEVLKRFAYCHIKEVKKCCTQKTQL